MGKISYYFLLILYKIHLLLAPKNRIIRLYRANCRWIFGEINFEIMKRREKSTMKKTLAILLSLALVICMIPATAVTAYAASGDVTLELNQSTVEYNGKAQSPTVKSFSVEGSNVEVVSIALQESGGTTSSVTEAGTYTPVVTYKVKGATTAEETKQAICNNVTFEIKKYDLAAHKVSISVDNQVDGTATIDMNSVHFFVDGSEATGELRALFTDNFNVACNNGTATVSESEGHDNFTNETLTATYKSVPSVGTLKITSATGVVYDGTVKNIKNLVSVTKGTGSVGAANYDVTCDKEVKDAGTYTLTIVGKGDYAGTATATLEVKPKDSKYVAISSVPPQVAGKIDVNANDLTVTDYINGKNATLTPGTDYNVTSAAYSRTKNNSTDIYYVTVRFIGNYTNDKTVEFDVVKSEYDIAKMTVYRGSKQLTSTSTLPAAYVYRGVSQPVSDITVYTDYANRKTLSTSYYDVVYEYTDEKGKLISTTSPIDAKNYDVYIVGKNGYAGKQKIGTYNIPQFDIKNTTISVSIASATSIPNVTVRSSYDNITFVKDKDYTVRTSSYVSNGRVLVTVSPTGTGNLTGSPRSDYYSIVARSISSCRVYFANGRNSASYTGSSIIVDVRVEDGYYNTLRERTDYMISYKLNGKTVSTIRDAGVYTIEIKGLNGYTGTTSLAFTVLGTDISSYTVTLKESSVNATGYNQTPTVLSVKRGYYTLSSGDYTVSYQDESGAKVKLMKAPGTYKVVVTGKNGYSGSTYATFTIIGKAQSITGVASSYKAYPGGEVIQLYPKATEGRFTYTSSDSTVATVSASGLVTPLKAGRAKITIKTTGTTTYDPATYSTVIKVYPKKAVMTKKPWNYGKKGQVKVRWYKQDNVTRYEIRYSRAKNFAKGTYITKKVNAAQNDYTTQSTTIKNLKSGQRYYVKVRAVKEVYNDYGKKLTYYGKWSGWRSVVVK